MHRARVTASRDQSQSIPMMELLEARCLLSASALLPVTIHTVLAGTPVPVVHAKAAKHTPQPKKPKKTVHKTSKPTAKSTAPVKTTASTTEAPVSTTTPVSTSAPVSTTTPVSTSVPVSTTTPVSTTPVAASSADPPVAGNWTSIFDDEFSGTTLNPVWHTAQYWDTSATVVGKGELEAYDSSAVSVSDGQLHLTARADNQYGVPYVSGLVETGGEEYNPSQPKFSFQYGFLEVSAKIPAGQGFWPAIWMMPASYQDGNGEIDVMEALGGNPKTAYFTVHHLALNGLEEQHSITGADLSAGFHTYGVDWEPNQITWYLDGVAVATVTNPLLIPHEPMYPIMNLAVGGTWGGAPNANTQFPSSMDIDYIRVWQNQTT